MDYLDQVLIEELEIFDDTNQALSTQEKDKAIVNYSNHGVSQQSIPVDPPQIFSNPDYDMSDNESQDHETPVKPAKSRPSDHGNSSIATANTNLVGSYKQAAVVHTTEKQPQHNKLDLSKPGKVSIPQPDYNEAPPLLSGRYVNSVRPTVEENVAKSSEQSFDSPTTFILPAAETYQPKLAKQIAYVKPNIKEPPRNQPSIPKRDYDDVTIIEKTGPSGNPRVMSMVLDTPSYVESRMNGFDEKDGTTKLVIFSWVIF